MTNEAIFNEHHAWLAAFFSGRWATRLREGTLTRDEYVRTLIALWSYVQDTTRLLGAMVQCSKGRKFTGLRKHYVGHLDGEINHELLIERDLNALGAHEAWEREPNDAAQAFGDFQRGLAVWDREPVLFLACPMTAEGVSAGMSTRPEYLEGLSSAVARWGYDPKSATSFLRSHVHTDGDDGSAHHLAVRRQVEKHVHTSADVRRFLAKQCYAQRTFLQAFESCCD